MSQTTQKTVAFITLGCKVNQYETDGMAQQLKEAGYELVSQEAGADVTIINTCAVTNIAQRKSRQMMSRARKKNPNTVLVAAGCYIQNAEKELDALKEVDLFLGNNQKNEIVSFLNAYFANRNAEHPNSVTEAHKHIIDINHTSEYEEFSIASTKEHTRAYVKIQDGCNQFCSYCIIPYVRGRVRSRKAEDIVNETKKLMQQGYKEIVLTGIHISSYGVDRQEEGNLLTLLSRLQAIDGIERIRLGSLEPRIITREFVSQIAKMPKICPHFHLSLQSGSDVTLKRMNRHYTTKEYEERVELLREYYKNPALTTDVIVGFPGETRIDFEQTYDYLERLNLYEMHIFKYSIREGTNAAKMPDQVDGSIKQERSERLLAMTARHQKAYQEMFLNTVEDVLFEEKIKLDEREYYVGHTTRYLKVVISAEDAGCMQEENQILNHILAVRLKSQLDADHILGELINN